MVRNLMVRMFILGAALLLSSVAVASPSSDPFRQVAKSYLVQVDGEQIWGKQTSKRLPPASLTKLMTALIVLEKTNPRDVVTVAPEVMRETGTRIRIRTGERFYVQDLLAATMIHSANDACRALAVHVGGNQKHFVTMMNQRARQMGLDGTHFMNACGHDELNHYSTSNDLAQLANKVIRYRSVATLVSHSAVQISTIDGGHIFRFKNTNALIGKYPGVIGLKTGYTPKAGKCLVAFAEDERRRVLLVMLNAPKRWRDAADMLDLAFAHNRLSADGG